MPSIQTTVWEASAHTLAKIAILKNYLQAWFRILGTTRKGETLLVIDGFAGPGRYSGGEEGSPIACLKTANGALFDMGSTVEVSGIHCVFFEKDEKRHNELTKSVATVTPHARLKVDHYNRTFEEGIAQLESADPALFRSRGPSVGCTQVCFITLGIGWCHCDINVQPSLMSGA
jgi:three-Cys-motif partner protein